MALEISGTMSKYQLALADRQCRMAELSLRCQDLITILCTSLYAARQSHELVRDAADLSCQELTAKYTGKRADELLLPAGDGAGGGDCRRRKSGFPGLEGIDAGEILMRYEA